MGNLFTKVRRFLGKSTPEPGTEIKPEPTAAIPPEPIRATPIPETASVVPPFPSEAQKQDSTTPGNDKKTKAKSANPFPSKVTGLSTTRMGRGWRTLLREGETGVYDAIAVLETKNRHDPNAVRIDITCWGEREKLGYLTSGVAATFRAVCAQINPDSEMGKAIQNNAIPCQVEVYMGDIESPIESDHYSYAFTDVVKRIKELLKEQQKQAKVRSSKSKPDLQAD